jgi:hypothetical protein
MLKEHKCICSRSEAFIPDATPQIEGLTVIMSKEWIEEAESTSSIIPIYYDFRILLCTTRDAVPQEIFYDPKVGVNVLSKIMAEHIAPKEPLTFSRKHLKWIDSQIVESKGIFRVISLKMGHNKIFLDFQIFDIPEGEEFVLSDPGLRDCVHNVVHTGLGDRTYPIPYLCCTLLACEVGLADTEASYSSCTRVRFLG